MPSPAVARSSAVVAVRAPVAAARTASAMKKLLVRRMAVLAVPMTMLVCRLAAANASGA